MRICGWIPLICCFAVVVSGCTSAKETPARSAKSVRIEDLVGKWRLVRVGGESPAQLEIKFKSQEVEIAADGSWTSKVEFQLPGLGVPDMFNANGKLTLPDSRIRVESGRMVVEPDFFMPARPKGTPEGASEYKR
jgi:hypothetical protein